MQSVCLPRVLSALVFQHQVRFRSLRVKNPLAKEALIFSPFSRMAINHAVLPMQS
jgi:hypothetical protein